MAAKRPNIPLLVTGCVLVLLALSIGGGYIWLFHDRQRPVRTLPLAAKPAITAPKVQKNYQVILEENLPQWISKATQGRYRATAGNITVDVPGRRISIDNLECIPDSAAGRQANAYRLLIPHLLVKGINWDGILNSNLDCDSIICDHLQLSVVKSGTPMPITNRMGGWTLAARYVEIIKPEISFRKTGSKPYDYHLKDGSIRLSDWQYTTDSSTDDTRFCFARSGTINPGIIIFNKPGIQYRLNLARMDFVAAKNDLLLKNICIDPLTDIETYYQKIGVEKETYNISAASAHFGNIDLRGLANGKGLSAATLTLYMPKVETFLSRYPPPDVQNHISRFPNQLLLQAGTKINIHEAEIVDGYAQYKEYSRVTRRSGEFSFQHISGTITNITNAPEIIAHSPRCVARLNGSFKGKSPSSAVIDFSLRGRDGSFKADVLMENVNSADISEDAEALSLTRVKSGHLHRIESHIQGSNVYAQGSATMLYNNLAIEIEKIDSTGEKDKHIKSFFANNVYLFPDNPMPGDKVRSADTYLQRDRLRSFFNILWAGIFQGAIKTAVKDQELAGKLAVHTDGKKHKYGMFKSFFKSAFRRKAK